MYFVGFFLAIDILLVACYNKRIKILSKMSSHKCMTRFKFILPISVLEAEMGLSGDTGNDDCEEESEERDPATLQARALVKLILNDINTVKKIAEFTH